VTLRTNVVKRSGDLLFRIAAGLMIIAAVSLLGGRVAHGTESWQLLLRHQLQEQQRCALDQILFVREIPVGNIVGLEGRVRCADTREFDFKRDHANEKFTVRLCEPVSVC
jgi:hypothetical protein